MDERFGMLYYTDALMADKRTLSILAILSDAVYIQYLSPDYFLKPLQERWDTEKDTPFFSKSGCEGALITELHRQSHFQFLRENVELVRAKVVRPLLIQAVPPDWDTFEGYEKRMMTDGLGLAIGKWGIDVGLVPSDKIYIDTAFYSLYRWQSFSGSLHSAITMGITPVSDNPILSSIACRTVSQFSGSVPDLSIPDVSKLLGFRVLSRLLPKFGPLQPEQILEVRHDLHDELMAFRYAMYDTVTRFELQEGDLEDAVYLVVKPRLDEIKAKLLAAKKSYYHGIIDTLSASGLGAAAMWVRLITLPTAAQVATGVGFGAFMAAQTMVQYLRYDTSRKELLSRPENNGLVLLLDLEKERS